MKAIKCIVCTTVFLLASAVFSTTIYAQNTYYTSDGENRLSKAELDEMTKVTKEKFEKLMKKELFVSAEIKEIKEKNDSIIKRISFNIIDKKTQDNYKSDILSNLIDQEFPHFELESLLGDKFQSKSLYGKPTLINFWFTKCAPCIDEMPVLNKIAFNYSNDFNFIAITYETKEKVEKFLEKHPFKFKQLVNAKIYTDSLEIKAFPLNFLIDANGVLKHIVGGIAYEMGENGKMEMGEGKELIRLLEKLKE
ncbi:TlpA family protein disulfide reductase [Cellulophaga baltica]|uniref:TlpA family protein disulfide reductase n=1 Tax=Cellulophaga baltica TaxID=76594 RepID=UPI0004106375|nr:TlpA disulfide reductase family protein [Cellulophaga baltica]MBA6313270.1 TlpA family protein disulfide reductase [Cellulophaga baltica]